jgi:hypothetical protein
MLTGLRGVGKTVLLNEIERKAREDDYRTIEIEAIEGKKLGPLLVPHLTRLLFDLDRVAGTGDKVRRGFRVLRSFLSGLKVTYQEVSVGMDVEPERGSADSGDLEIDLPNLFAAVAEAAEERKTAVAVLIDEIQYLDKKEFAAVIMAMHKAQQRQLPLALLGAGLPILVGMAGESKSYAERLFNFPEVGALSELDSAKALVEPAKTEGVDFEKEAVDEIFRLTKGYPYFLQEWGYQTWNLAAASPISLEVVHDASEAALLKLDENFFRVRFDRLTQSEKNYLRAMADLGPGAQRTGDIANTLGVKATSLSGRCGKLIRKGMIYSPSHGEVAFTVPLFDEFMRRIMPGDEWMN